MRRIVFILILLVFVYFSASAVEMHNYVPANGVVPDAMTAIKIAEAVWLPIYGQQVLTKKPFKAVLKGGVWIVTGTLADGSVGGVPLAEISKASGEVARISHGK